jgi:heterodisulfide reductase subunit C
LDLIQRGTLISLKPSGFTEFEVIETGQRLTIEDLVGSSNRLVDIEKEYKPLREKLKKQEISRKEFETQKEALTEQIGQSKFYITQLSSIDMFITKNKTWLGKLGLRGQS